MGEPRVRIDIVQSKTSRSCAIVEWDVCDLDFDEALIFSSIIKEEYDDILEYINHVDDKTWFIVFPKYASDDKALLPSGFWFDLDIDFGIHIFEWVKEVFEVGMNKLRERNKIMNNTIRETIELTPATAKEFLENARKNRNINKRHIEMLARDIRSGDFQYTGIPIILDENGKMFDGQHRCHAVILANKPITVDIIKGLKYEQVFSVIDTGKTRAFCQALSLQNVPHSAATAAALRIYLKLTNKKLHTADTITDENLSNKEGLFYYEMFSDISDFIWLTSINKIGLRATCFVAAAYYLFRDGKRQKENIFSFFNQFASGENLASGSPVLALRNKLLSLPLKKLSSTWTYRKRVIGLTLKMYLAWEKNKIVKVCAENNWAEDFPYVN